MPSFNNVTLIGNLTRDPQLKYLPNQTAVCEFGLAVNRHYTKDNEKKQDVCFIDCACFGNSAETLSKYVTKGAPLFVSGRLKFDQWEDKAGGKRSKLSVVVEHFQFLDRGDANSGADAPDEQPYPRTRESIKQQRVANPIAIVSDGEEHFKDDEIPF